MENLGEYLEEAGIKIPKQTPVAVPSETTSHFGEIRRFASKKMYRIGRLRDGAPTRTPNPTQDFHKDALTKTGAWFQTKTAQEFFEKNPHGITNKKIHYIYEVGDGGNLVYFSEGTFEPRKSRVKLADDDVVSPTVQQQSQPHQQYPQPVIVERNESLPPSFFAGETQRSTALIQAHKEMNERLMQELAENRKMFQLQLDSLNKSFQAEREFFQRERESYSAEITNLRLEIDALNEQIADYKYNKEYQEKLDAAVSIERKKIEKQAAEAAPAFDVGAIKDVVSGLRDMFGGGGQQAAAPAVSAAERNAIFNTNRKMTFPEAEVVNG